MRRHPNERSEQRQRPLDKRVSRSVVIDTSALTGEAGDVVYRLRIYRLIPENADLFSDFILTGLLPVQLRLVGGRSRRSSQREGALMHSTPPRGSVPALNP